MPTNYAAHARIADQCHDNGVRESDIEIYLAEYDDRKFEEAEMTPEWWKQQKAARPLRFIGVESAEDELIRSAASGNITDQGRLVRKLGKAGAAEAMARHGATLGSTKPGTDPTADKKRDNPWLRPDDPAAKAERLRLIARGPSSFVNGLAKAAGVDLACRPLRKRA